MIKTQEVNISQLSAELNTLFKFHQFPHHTLILFQDHDQNGYFSWVSCKSLAISSSSLVFMTLTLFQKYKHVILSNG